MRWETQRTQPLSSVQNASDPFSQKPSLSKESHTGFINEAPSGGSTKGTKKTSFEKAETTQIPRDGFSLLLGKILEGKLYHMKGTGFHSFRAHQSLVKDHLGKH